MVKNLSSQNITIRYELEDSKSGTFNIFTAQPDGESLSNKGTLDYKDRTKLEDKDTTWNGIEIILKPNYAMVFGNLSNDHYINKDQYFINSRTFNFNMMEIEYGDNLIKITKNNFDDYFRKEKGIIAHEVK